MSNAEDIKRPNRKERRQLLQRQQSQEPIGHRLSPVRQLKFLVSGILGFVTIFGFLFLIYPRISVYPGTSSDAYGPFQTPFVVKNDGYLPIRDIQFSLTVDVAKVPMPNWDISNNTINILPVIIPKLSPNKTSVVASHLFMKLPPVVTHAEIHINLKYKPYLVPFVFTYTTRYTTDKTASGTFIWLEDYRTK